MVCKQVKTCTTIGAAIHHLLWINRDNVKHVQKLIDNSLLLNEDVAENAVLDLVLAYEAVKQGVELLGRSGAITDPALNATLTVWHDAVARNTATTQPPRRRKS